MSGCTVSFDDGRIMVQAASADEARILLPEVRVIEAARGGPGLYEAPVAPRTIRRLREVGLSVPADIDAAATEHVRQMRQIEKLRGRLFDGALPPMGEYAARGTTLRRVQHVGALIALSADRAALFMDMGTGKTLASLTACAHRFKRHGLRRVLVVAPATVAGGWAGDIERLAMRDQVEFVHAAGSPSKRRKQYARAHLVGNGDEYLSVAAVNYGSLANDAQAICDVFDPQAVIIDESHYIKNLTSDRTGACQVVADHARWVTLLTGTPYSEQPTDVFAQYRVLDWRIFGWSRDVFAQRFAKTSKNYAAGEHAPDKVELDPDKSSLLNKAIYLIGFRARKDDVLDLPAKRPPIMHRIALSSKSTKVIQSLRRSGLADLDAATGARDLIGAILARVESAAVDATSGSESAVAAFAVPAADMAAALDAAGVEDTKRDAIPCTVAGLRQLANRQRMVVASTRMVIGLRVQQAAGGFAKVADDDGDESADPVQIGTEKLDALRDLATSLHAESESVVVFARFRAEIAAIEDRLARIYGKANVSRIDGSVPTGSRAGVVEAFQADGPPRAIVLQVSSGAAGITLTRARHAAYYSMGYSATDYWQSQDRTHRIGQGRECFYHLLVAEGSDDEVTIDALAHKRKVADAVIESWR